jgi:hypothetical protein
MRCATAAAVFAAVLCGRVTAGPTDPVIKPVAVTGGPGTATSFSGGAGELVNLINGDTDAIATNNGLIQDGNSNPHVPVAVVTESDALTFEHRNIFTSEPMLGKWHWVAAGRNGGDFSDFFDPALNNSPIWIAFNLGGTFDVSGMFVWRYNGGFGSIEQNNPKNWTIEFSTNGGASYGNQEVIPTLTNAGVGGQAVNGELLSFPAHHANFVKITVTDNFNGEPGLAFGGDRVGLAEVRFQGLAVAANNGDYNRDGVVDAADYVMWRKDPGSDPDGFNMWRQTFGSGGSGSLSFGPGSVPEPSGVAVAIGGFIVLFQRSRSVRPRMNEMGVRRLPG